MPADFVSVLICKLGQKLVLVTEGRINKQMPASFNVVSYSLENIEMVYCHQSPSVPRSREPSLSRFSPTTRRSGGKQKTAANCELIFKTSRRFWCDLGVCDRRQQKQVIFQPLNCPLIGSGTWFAPGRARTCNPMIRSHIVLPRTGDFRARAAIRDIVGILSRVLTARPGFSIGRFRGCRSDGKREENSTNARMACRFESCAI